jgi:TolB protein
LQTQSSTDREDGWLAFETFDGNFYEVCLVQLDGSNQRCLARTEGITRNPVWSPDGAFLTYQSTDQTDANVPKTYIYDFVQDRTSELSQAFYIYDWSPDGQFLLTVQREGVSPDGEIYLLRPDESEGILLTDNDIADALPVWSPDGSQIAFLRDYPKANVMVMSPDGASERRLTVDHDVNALVPLSWSPDSQTIAFVVNGEIVDSDQTSEIYLVNVDGTHVRQLTSMGSVILGHSWSPDGTQIVFYGYAAGAFDDLTDTTTLRTDVFMINADGTDLVNLTQNTGWDNHPAWSPDGEWIAFAGARGTPLVRPQLRIMRPDGSDTRIILEEPPSSEGGRDITNPVWRPVAGGG